AWAMVGVKSLISRINSEVPDPIDLPRLLPMRGQRGREKGEDEADEQREGRGVPGPLPVARVRRRGGGRGNAGGQGRQAPGGWGGPGALLPLACLGGWHPSAGK